MKPVLPPHRVLESVAPDHRLTAADIEEFGLEEAPPGAGPSWEEIAEMRRRQHAEGQ